MSHPIQIEILLSYLFFVKFYRRSMVSPFKRLWNSQTSEAVASTWMFRNLPYLKLLHLVSAKLTGLFNLPTFAASTQCGNLQIYCPYNGQCLNKTLQCNKKTDCPDGSDEAHCSKNLHSCLLGCKVERDRHRPLPCLWCLVYPGLLLWPASP